MAHDCQAACRRNHKGANVEDMRVLSDLREGLLPAKGTTISKVPLQHAYR